ncbi:MAG: restriction endonuclease subunit S [Chlorobi bacterium]|nr:restriction endonuclease subunit S [Chlorobiota bacterium]
MTISVYPEYKESGVPWLGHVPEHWEVKRLKYVATLITRKSCVDEQAVALENIESWTARYLATDSEFEGDGVSFESGDILFGKLRPYLAKAWLAEFNGTAVGDFHVLRLRNVFDGRFACYLLLSQGYISLIDGSTFGAKMPRVSWEFMGNTVIPLPPFEEQRAIASFLDRKTAQIDELIAKKEALLKKLDEKRTAIITQAVTKGLDPSVPMKDSGVEWIGKIPEHWIVLKITHGFKTIGSGTTPKSDNSDFYDGNIPWVTTSELRETVIENTTQNISIDAFQTHSALKIYPTGSIVIAMYGATIGRLGILGVDATVNQACCVFAQPATFVSVFFYYWLIMRKPILLSQSTGGGQPNLSLEDLKHIRIPTPPIEEQQAIAEHIEKKTAIIDRQRAQVTEAIQRLKEYRRSLITNAVTGNIQITAYYNQGTNHANSRRLE